MWTKFDPENPPKNNYFLIAPKGTTCYDHLEIVRQVNFWGKMAYQNSTGHRVYEDEIEWWYPLPELPLNL